MFLKFAEYNPLSLSREGRLEHIIDELKADVVALSGTGLRQDRRRGTYSTWKEGDYQLVSWGHDSKQPFSYKSAGVIPAT